MKITCGSCAAKYTVSDEKVQGKTVKVKCRKCGAVIVVSSTGEVQTTGGGAGGGASAAASVSYTVSISDTDQRTLTLDQIVDAYNEGVIDAETFLWTEGMDDWLPLKDVDAIVDALHDAASAEASMVPHEDLAATVAVDYGASAGAPMGGSPMGGMGGGNDLGATVAMADAAAALSSGSSRGSSPPGLGLSGGGGGFFSSPGGGGSSSFADVSGSASASGGGGGTEENSAILSEHAHRQGRGLSGSQLDDRGLWSDSISKRWPPAWATAAVSPRQHSLPLPMADCFRWERPRPRFRWLPRCPRWRPARAPAAGCSWAW